MTKKLKKPIAFLTVFAMLMSMLMYFPAGTFGGFDFGVSASAAAVTPSQPTSGDGSSGNPYQITSAAELYWFASRTEEKHSACAILMDDITLNNGVFYNNGNLKSGMFNEWTPITEYYGIFNGNDKCLNRAVISLLHSFFNRNCSRRKMKLFC